jgi:hypothetical protein
MLSANAQGSSYNPGDFASSDREPRWRQAAWVWPNSPEHVRSDLVASAIRGQSRQRRDRVRCPGGELKLHPENPTVPECVERLNHSLKKLRSRRVV